MYVYTWYYTINNLHVLKECRTRIYFSMSKIDKSMQTAPNNSQRFGSFKDSPWSCEQRKDGRFSHAWITSVRHETSGVLSFRNNAGDKKHGRDLL